jgi:PilZ domain
MVMTEQRGLEARIGVSVGTADRRSSDRVPGPFDAWRVGVLETPVRIYDVSLGGCFVHAMHEQERGVVVMLKIQMPEEGWLELKAETLYRRPGFGFAVKFIDMSEDTRARLARALEALGSNPQPW